MEQTRANTVIEEAVLTTATATAKVNVTNAETLLVVWTITDSGATGDIGTTTVKPYSPTNGTPALIETILPASVTVATTRVGTAAVKTDRYDVRGLEQVQLSITNAAGGTKNVAVHTYIGG